MRRMLLLILVLSGCAMTVFAQADPQAQTEDKEPEKSYLYQWTDDKGVVHIADGLEKVPKKYLDKAIQLTQPEKEDVGQGRQVPQPSVYPSGAEPEAADAAAKGAWQQRMRQAKQRLAEAEQRYQKLDERRNELLRSWGADAFGRRTERIEAEMLEQQMKGVQTEIDAARKNVEVDLPDEARREGVPPGWLRE